MASARPPRTDALGASSHGAEPRLGGVRATRRRRAARFGRARAAGGGPALVRAVTEAEPLVRRADDSCSRRSLAALRLRVAAARSAAAERCVGVCVATPSHSSLCFRGLGSPPPPHVAILTHNPQFLHVEPRPGARPRPPGALPALRAHRHAGAPATARSRPARRASSSSGACSSRSYGRPGSRTPPGRERLRRGDAAGNRRGATRRSIGLIAHVDTSPDAPGAGVEPMVHEGYDGGVIELPRERHRARSRRDARAARSGRPRHRHLQRRHAARRRRQGRRRGDHGRRSRTWPRTPSCRARRCGSASPSTRRSARARRSSTSSASARAAPTRWTARARRAAGRDVQRRPR